MSTNWKVGLLRRTGYATAAILLLMLLFDVLPRALDVPKYIFPPLSDVMWRIGEDRAYLAPHLLTTFAEALVGLTAAAAIGVGLGMATRRRPGAASAGLRGASVLQTIPIVAVAPLIILWSGPGFVSKVVMATLIGVPPLIIASIEGFRAPPADLINALEVMGCSRRNIFFAVRLPYAFKQIAIGLRVSAALVTIGAIVAEYAGSTKGIGYVIMQSSYRLDTPLMFAAVILAILIGLFLVGLARAFDGYVTRALTGR